MKDGEALVEFKEALRLLRNQYPSEALAHIQRAVQLEAANPIYLSYLGLLLGQSERKWAEAEKLCNAALQMKRNHAQLYLNLAEVYVNAGRRGDAVETLTMGLRYAGRDIRLTRALERLGVRHPPVLRFLDRANRLNRYLGKLRRHAQRIFATA